MRLLLVVGLLWTVAAPAQAAGCPAGSVLVGQKEVRQGDTIVVHPLCRRVPSCAGLPATPQEVEREYEGLRRELQGNTVEAVRNADLLEEWASLSAKSREEARKKAYGLGLEVVVQQALTKTAKHFRETEMDARMAEGVNGEWGRQVGQLSRLTPEEKAAALAPIKSARTREQAAIAIRDTFSVIKNAYDINQLPTDGDWKVLGARVAAALKLTESLFYSNPATGLLIADFEALENATYGWWAALAAKKRLEQFVALEDKLLDEAIRESSRYVTLSTAMSAIRRGEPYCASAPMA